MKTRIIFFGLILAGCSSPTPSANTPPAANSVAQLTPGQIKALIVVGDVRAIDATNKSRALQKDDIIAQGETIVAGPDSGATLVFSNGATARVKENSQVQVIRFLQAPFDAAKEGSFIRLARDPSRSEVDLKVRAGSVMGEVKQLNKGEGSYFRISSPDQGTRDVDGIFSITVPPTNAPQISTTNGAIQPGTTTTTASASTQATQAQILELFYIINTDRAKSGLPPIPPPTNMSALDMQALLTRSYQIINTARAQNGLPPVAPPTMNFSTAGLRG